MMRFTGREKESARMERLHHRRWNAGFTQEMSRELSQDMEGVVRREKKISAYNQYDDDDGDEDEEDEDDDDMGDDE
jgi:hypothetical protein